MSSDNAKLEDFFVSDEEWEPHQREEDKKKPSDFFAELEDMNPARAQPSTSLVAQYLHDQGVKL